MNLASADWQVGVREDQVSSFSDVIQLQHVSRDAIMNHNTLCITIISVEVTAQ